MKDLYYNKIPCVDVIDQIMVATEDIFKDCKRGYYTITKQSGNNETVYAKNHREHGISQGIREGYGMLITTPDRYFITSPVKSITWDDENSGSFETKNSIYKFTYKSI